MTRTKRLFSHILKLLSVMTVATIIFTAGAPAKAQAILGNWQTASGTLARISKCGASFCITLRSGKHKGKRIGRLNGKGTSYSGTITDPNSGKVYNGSASVNGRSMALSGCVLRLFCRSQTWTRR